MTKFEAPTIRLLDRLYESGTLCLECGQATQDSKPYCEEHVERMPYVERLLQVLATPSSESAA